MFSKSINHLNNNLYHFPLEIADEIGYVIEILESNIIKHINGLIGLNETGM